MRAFISCSLYERFLKVALRRPYQPSHDIAELIEVAILDVNCAAAVAMIDRDGETECIRHVFFHRDRVGFLLARLTFFGLAVASSECLHLAHIEPALDDLAGD